MKKIYVKNGFSFDYETSSDIGSIANIDPNNDDLEIQVDQKGSKYHCKCYINGIYILIWCIKYTIRKIGE